MTKTPPPIPKKLYQDQFLVAITYGNFDVRENAYYIPDTFMTFLITEWDINESGMVDRMLRESYKEYLEDINQEEEFDKVPAYLYWQQFPTETAAIAFEKLVNDLNYKQKLMDMEDYYMLVRHLPNFKETKVS